jgi:thiamine-phosphate pyrophosphorylase
LSYHGVAMAQRPKKAEPRTASRFYLITPPGEETSALATALATLCAGSDVAAVLLRSTAEDERSLINRAKTLCPVAQETGAALLLDGHAELAARAGADGAHLTGIDAFSEALERLKPERIAGAGGLTSRHDAMTAAEAGADYVMFGEPDASGLRPSFAAIEERVAWWAEVFEIPCVGYAASPDEVAPLVKAGADFVALGDWLWRDPAAAIAQASQHLRLPETAT